MVTKRFRMFVLLGFPTLVIVVFFVAPLAITALSSVFSGEQGITFDNYVKIVSTPRYLSALVSTMRISLLVAVFSLVLGYIIAYYMVMVLQSKLSRRIAYVIVILPLFTSNIVRSFGFMIILGRSGFLNDTLLQLGVIDRPLRILYTEASVVIGLTYICLPFVVLAVVASLQSIDKSLFQASTDLGGDAWSTFWNVTWPLSLPGVLGGTVLAFTISVSAYVTPSVMLGGRGSVMSIVIYDQYMAAMNFNFGAALAVALTITALVLMVFQSTVMERKLKWART